MKKIVGLLLVFTLLFGLGCPQENMENQNVSDSSIAEDTTIDSMDKDDEINEDSVENNATMKNNTLMDDNVEDDEINDADLEEVSYVDISTEDYLGDGSLDNAIPTLDKDATYLVYCHVDSVAILGAQKLINAGFKNVYRLEGNYGGWVAAGYPIEQ